MNAATPTSTERRLRAARKHSMTSHPTLRLLVLACLGSLLAAPSLAQEGGYFYGGLSAGQSRAKIDQDRITAGLLGAGLTTSGFSTDESGKAFRLFGGYQINRHFGVEAGYFDLGKFSFAATTVPAGTLNRQIRLQGLNHDLVGKLPLTDRLSLIARVGAQAAKARDNFSGSGAVAVLNPNPSKRAVGAKFGAGLQYEFSRSFILRAEAERYRVDDAVGNKGDVNVVSVSLVFPFGRTEAARPRAMAPPPVYEAPVAQAPAAVVAEPVVVVAPLPVAAPVAAFAPPTRRVSYSAESFFNFDQSELRPEGRQALDTFVGELKGTTFDTITVQGHADRIGTTEYNQTLSQARAEAVKTYLVSTGGLDSTKIAAKGRSESEPVTLPEACKGPVTAAVVACLQPDRRVEIEVTGSR